MSDLLLPTTSALKRRKYAVIDIESKDGDSQKAGFTRPFMAGWYAPETGYWRSKGPQCVEMMLAYACQEKFDGWLFYAHNGGSFDWLHFLPAIHAAGYHYELTTVGSSIQLLKVKRSATDKSKGWTFLDSAKLIPMSLEKATKAFGVTLKLGQDLDAHEDDPSWDEYLKGDCISLHELLVRYHELVEIRLQGEVGITAASTAMRTFRRGFQKAPIYRHSEHHELFRAAYYGGRVERFASKVSGIRVYDINSSYPHSMLGGQPVGPAQPWEGEPTRYLRSNCHGFVRARVRVPSSCNIPILPYRVTKRGEEKLLFPTGEFDGVWVWDELERALEHGTEVLEYRDSVWIDSGIPFEEMINTLYRYRDASLPGYDEGLSALSKLMANSLYGKFGMREERERLVRIPYELDIPDGARSANPLDDECELWYVPEEAHADYVCPQIAANVTCQSRLSLATYFYLAASSGILAYGDTDSIHTTADLSGYVGSKLGMLKDEGKGVTYEAEYLQPKLYMLLGSDGSEKLTAKGFKPPKQGRRAYYERIKSGETITFESLEKIGSLAKRSFASPPRMRAISRSLSSEDGKRVMLTATTSKPVEIYT